MTAANEYVCSTTAVMTVGRNTSAYAFGNATEPIAAIASASVARASRITSVAAATGVGFGSGSNGDGFSAPEPLSRPFYAAATSASTSLQLLCRASTD